MLIIAEHFDITCFFSVTISGGRICTFDRVGQTVVK